MYIPIWLLWVIAVSLAAMPLSTLLIARKVDKVRPKRRRAKPVEFIPLVAGEGVLVNEEAELRYIAYVMAQSQMRQRWGKDIDHIE